MRVGVEEGWPSRPARWHVWRDPRVLVPCATLHNWGEAGGKKAPSRMGTAFLDWALAECAGDVALDAWSDGPCGVLSAVAHRRSKRLLDAV